MNDLWSRGYICCIIWLYISKYTFGVRNCYLQKNWQGVGRLCWVAMNIVLIIMLLRKASQIQHFKTKHCVKSVHVQSYSGLYFPAFGLNTDQNNSEYGHFSRREKSKQKYHMEWLNWVWQTLCFWQFLPICKKSQNGKCILHDTVGISYSLVSLEKCDKSNVEWHNDSALRWKNNQQQFSFFHKSNTWNTSVKPQVNEFQTVFRNDKYIDPTPNCKKQKLEVAENFRLNSRKCRRTLWISRIWYRTILQKIKDPSILLLE